MPPCWPTRRGQARAQSEIEIRRSFDRAERPDEMPERAALRLELAAGLARGEVRGELCRARMLVQFRLFYLTPNVLAAH
jgi:hypothetical protein